MSFFIYSPLEQFEINPLIYLGLSTIGSFPFCLTNSIFILILTILVILFILQNVFTQQKNLSIIPNVPISIFEIMYEVVSDLVAKNIGEKGRNFFPFVFTIFIFILICNLSGMFPYSFTLTSHLSVTLSLSAMVFFAANIIGILKWKRHFIVLFLPPGASLGLALMLIPIEFISYMFRIISLAVRLFANMMAGHTLLKVIGGFFWSLTASSGALFYLSIIPLLALIILTGLELGVAMIQAFVFTILTCFYLNDAINLH